MASTICYYDLLGVARDADGATLKSAYRKLAMRHHPDRNPGCAESEATFKELGAAYACLSDPQKRAVYDRYGREAYEGQQGGGFGAGGFADAAFGDIGDIFDTIFGGGFGGRQRGPARGADLRYDLEITLEDAFHGKTVELEIDVSVACAPCDGSGAEPGTGVRRCAACAGHGKVRAQQGFFVVERPCAACAGRGEMLEQPCRRCHGVGRVDEEQSLEVEVPAGVDEGTRIRLGGRGEAGEKGAPPGDLYIFVHVAPHAVFRREGTTLHARAPIGFATAALGGELTVPGLDGTEHQIRIPAGIQSGRQLRQRGAGMPALRGAGVGDLVVEIAVETPTKLTARQKELLREFQETEGGDPQPHAGGFLSKLKEALG